MKKYFIVSIVLISILLTSCGYQVVEDVSSTGEQEIENDDVDEKDIIKIYSTNENEMIQKVIDIYGTKYPDIMIEYIIGNSKKNEDILKEMLQKKGPDIIITENIFEEALLKNNVLLDINNQISTEDNIPNFKESYNQYIIPLRFGIPFLFIKYETPNHTINEIIQNSDKFQVSNLTYEEFIELMYLYYEHDLLDEKNDINETNLMEFIENIVSIAKTQDFVEDSNNKNELDLINNYLSGSNTIMYHLAVGIDDIKYYLSATAIERGKAFFVQKSIMPYEKIALNQNSKYKEECISFIQLALSYDIQKIDFGNGFPINEKALDEWGNTYVESDIEIPLELKSGTVVKLDDPPVEEIKTMMNLVKELPNIYTPDIELLSLIQAESKKYYDEQETLKQITENIIKKYIE